MRWKKEVKFDPYLGHEKIVDKFLIFPICIDGDCRWLEKTKIKQVYTHGEGRIGCFYKNKEWLNE